METILAIALIISSVLHIIFAIQRTRDRKEYKELEEDYYIVARESAQKPISIPTAEDARFLRKQNRNPSWKKIYEGINKAIQNGEDHFDFHFHSDPQIPFNEIKEELESLGYTVSKKYSTLTDDSDFVVKWG